MRVTLFLGFLLCRVASLNILVSSLKQPAANLLSSYVKLLSTKPMVTNVVTASALAVLSDSISQKAEKLQVQTKSGTNESPPPQQHSWYRSLCMAIYGATVYGYLIIYWFKLLNFLVPQEGITRAKVVLKVCINQLVMSPLLNSLFFTWVCCTRDLTSSWSEKIAQTKLKLSRDLIPTIKRSCAYWGVAQYINFWYVSRIAGKEFQLVYVNLSFVLWTTYLAYIGYKRIDR